MEGTILVMTRLRAELLLLGTLLTALLVLLSSNEFSYHGCVVTYTDNKFATAEVTAIPQDGSILFYPYAAVRKMLLNMDPNVYRVQFSVNASLPLMLHIQLFERIPQVVLKYKKQWFGLDETGTVFPMAERTLGVKEIELSSEPHFVSGSFLPASSAHEIRGLLQVMNSWSWPRFSRASMDQNGGLTFFTKEGIIIRVPSLTGLTERFKLLSPLLQVIREKKIKSAYIDLSSEEMPVFKVLSR